MLKTRVKTAIVLGAVVVAILAFSHISVVMKSFVALLSVLGVYELYSAVKLKNNKVAFYISLVVAAVLPFVKIPAYSYVVAVAFLIAVIAFVILMLRFGKYNLSSWKKILPMGLMIPLFYSSFVYLRELKYGLYYILMFVLVCFFTDTGAYFIGKGIGKHHLAPKVSPKKTMEGSIGGMLCAVIFMILIGWIVDLSTTIVVNYLFLLIYTVIASVIGQLGDLSMSVIKRVVGLKDYSNLMPGHGGVLDRFDSYMFAAPFTFIFYSFINHIIK